MKESQKEYIDIRLQNQENLRDEETFQNVNWSIYQEEEIPLFRYTANNRASKYKSQYNLEGAEDRSRNMLET